MSSPPEATPDGRLRPQRAGTFLRSLAAAAFALLLVAGASGAASHSGGAGVTPPPRIGEARCLEQAAHPCIDPMWVEPGGAVRLRGRFMASVRSVVFYGRRGRADDARAPALARGSGGATATVPAGARSGPLAVVTDAGERSRRWKGLVVDGPAEAPPLPPQSGNGPAIGTRISKPRRIFYGGLRKAVFSYRVAASSPVDVTVNLLRLSDQVVVRSWQQPQVQPAATQRVVWDGTAEQRAQPAGLYAFQVVTAGAAGASARSSAGKRDAVALRDHIFPVRGRHDYGSGGARFGAGRGGRGHQGHDVFARCRTPLVAARAGEVVYKGYHALAGYYLVIAGSGSGQDYVYMHLRGPALVAKGDSVYTGQPLGEVGESGNAHGCHLHFELWSGPGWYRGGKPFDPLPELRRWDGFS